MKPIQTEGISQGFYRSPQGKDYPKMQIIAIEELLSGKKPDTPSWAWVSSIETPPKSKRDEAQVTKML
jgi:hypothetical protein